MKLVDVEEMRAIEAEAVRQGTPLDDLMQRAGTALADAALAVGNGPILILVGPGNNGGDGLVAARRLRALGRECAIYLFKRENAGDIQDNLYRSEEDADRSALRDLLARSAVVVDSLLGIGQNRPIAGELAAIVEAVNDADRPAARIACDIPTGIDADSGRVLERAFRATGTVCMGFAKVGAASLPGAAYAGTIQVAAIGLPRDMARNARATLSDGSEIADILPVRHPDSNKGTFGRVLIIGGSRDFLGAPTLASLAALRSGAGLAQVASIAPVVTATANHALEPIYAHLAERDGKISGDAIDVLQDLLAHASSAVIGPGMGLADDTIALCHRLLDTLSGERPLPAVIDADGLNALSHIDRWWECGGEFVLTPHPGEMGRLSGLPIADIQANRVTVARDHAARWNVVLVLKGAQTVIAAPDGRIAINPTGGPNLATGGTGDVLSGIIGGLLAQGMDRFDAARAGTFIHGLSGDAVARELGDAGTLAGDLLSQIPRVRHRILSEEGEMPR